MLHYTTMYFVLLHAHINIYIYIYIYIYVTVRLNGRTRTCDTKLVGVGPARPRRAGVEPSRTSRAEPRQPAPGHAWSGRGEPSRAEPSSRRADPSWAKPNRAEPARDPKLNFVPAYGDITLLVFFQYLPHRMLTFWTTFLRTPPADLEHKIGGPSQDETGPRQAEPSQDKPGRTGMILGGPGQA